MTSTYHLRISGGALSVVVIAGDATALAG